MGNKRVQKEKTVTRQEKEVQVEVAANPEVVEKGEELKEEMDDLIDKIDDLLEENSEEFIKNYVQKGGE